MRYCWVICRIYGCMIIVLSKRPFDLTCCRRYILRRCICCCLECCLGSIFKNYLLFGFPTFLCLFLCVYFFHFSVVLIIPPIVLRSAKCEVSFGSYLCGFVLIKYPSSTRSNPSTISFISPPIT